jgi:hypothetical protein
MNGPLAGAAWPACHSALRLDRWMAGELPRAEAEELAAHVAACARCRAAVAAMEEERDRTELPPLRPAPAARAGRAAWFGLRGPARRAGIPGLTLAGVALAAAAVAAVILVRPDPGGERTKGASPGLSMYVQHGDDVRRAGPGERVAPGDAVRFAVSLRRPAYVAVLTLDPAGRASVYFPGGARAEPITPDAPGTEVALPLATRLDETQGQEQVFGLFCDQPVELEPLRARLAAVASGFDPPGCQVIRWTFEKR